MIPVQNLYLFFVASLMLNLTPGNDMIYVASRSVSQGSRAGIISAIGIFLGCFVHIGAAILGISLLIARSAALFNLLKWAGAGYLIFLGIKAWSKSSSIAISTRKMDRIDRWKLLKQGITTNVLNPKVAIFFLSFLPQFVNPATSAFRIQLLILGFWFALQGTLILIAVAIILGRIKDFFGKNPKIWMIQERITGVILIGLGVKLAITGRK